MTTDNRTNEPTPNPTAEQVVRQALDDRDWYMHSEEEAVVAALRAHGLLSESAPSEEQIERAQKQLAAEIHEAWEFQYDECDHGTYRGGHLNGEPYAMCEVTAARIVRRRAALVAAARAAEYRKAVESDEQVEGDL